MQSTDLKIDTKILMKLAPLVLGLGAGLGVIVHLIYLGGFWGVVLLFAWVFLGGYYTETLLKSGGSGLILSLGLNGALNALIGVVVYELVSGIIVIIGTKELYQFFSISMVIEALVVGALAAIVWNTYRTGSKS